MIFLPIFGLFIGFIIPLLCQKAISDVICIIAASYWIVFIIFLLFYEVICLVYSVTLVQNYNRREVRHQ
jgi:hypothetical protein